ncbi:hypothetical protein GCM10027402_09250 [Arthrobacter monumenti]
MAEAFSRVPRHIFLPGVDPEVAYSDEAVVTETADDGRPLSSSSQPAIMAAMLEQLAVEPGQRVLEIGAGTGYNAALLARLVGDGGTVTTIDIDQKLVDQARGNLAAAGFPEVSVACGDGADGWPENAPYDRIICTAGARDLTPSWTNQLADGGRMVLPLSLRGMQLSVGFEAAGDHLASVSLVDCGFMPLRGALAGPDPVRSLGNEPGILLQFEGDRVIDADLLYSALHEPGDIVPIGVTLSPGEIRGGLGVWLVLHEPDTGQLSALGTAVERGLVPAVIAFPGMALTTVLIGRNGLAALVPQHGAGTNAGGIAVRTFGRDADDAGARLAARVREWDVRGRPSTADLRIRAYPHGTRTGDAAFIIEKRFTKFLLDWNAL